MLVALLLKNPIVGFYSDDELVDVGIKFNYGALAPIICVYDRGVVKVLVNNPPLVKRLDYCCEGTGAAATGGNKDLD